MFNTNHDSEVNNRGFSQLLQEYGLKISMYGKYRYNDTIFVGRL